MTAPIGSTDPKQSVTESEAQQIVKETDQAISSEQSASLKEPVEIARELLGWTMELLTLLAIPLSAQSVLPPAAYPYPGMRQDIQDIDQWIRQTKSHLGSLSLGLRGCNLIFWSELIVAKRNLLVHAQTELAELAKLATCPEVQEAQNKITAALQALEKEEKSYLEQKRSWCYRAFQQTLRITQPYLKEMGRVASLATAAKIVNKVFTWTISALGLLFSGQAFKKALTDWKIYKKGSDDFEGRIRFPKSIEQPRIPADDEPTLPSASTPTEYIVLDIHDDLPWLQKKREDEEQEIQNIVGKWNQFIPQIISIIQSIPTPSEEKPLTEEEYLQQQFGVQEQVAKDTAKIIRDKDLKNLVNTIDLEQSKLHFMDENLLDVAQRKCLAKLLLHQQQARLHAVKNGLLEMVSAKQRMEGAFLKIKLGDTGSVFTISTLQFVAQLALLILGLATVSFGGAGVVLFWLGVASFAATGAISLSSTYYVTKRRYHRSIEEFKFVNARIFYANLRKNIAKHRLARYSLTIAQPDDTCQKMERNIKKWQKKEDCLRERLAQATWQDFAEEHLYQWQKWGQPEEVVLQELSRALKGIDPQLLSKESNQFLQEYFSIRPEHFRADSDTIKKQLRRFFTFDDSDLVKFMKTRENR